MFIIDAANPKPEADAQSLDRLLDAYDIAKTDEERERVAANVYELIGGSVRGMVSRAAGNQRLTPDQIDALAWQGLFRGLNESGVTRLKRSDAEWETFIEKCRQPGHGPGNRIWGLLSPPLKEALEAPYLKSTTADILVRELNALLRRRDLYDSAAFSAVPLNQEATALLKRGVENLPMTVLTRLNALAVSTAFPELRTPERPPRNLLGYIKASVVPKLRAQVSETVSGQPFDSHLQEALSFLRPDIDAVREMEATGTLPDEWMNLSPAGRIYQHQKQRLAERYGPALKWWHDRLRDSRQPSLCDHRRSKHEGRPRPT